MIIDAGHHLDLQAVREMDAAHDIHLPQLHRPAPLPPPVILPPPAPLPGLHQPMAHQRPVHRRAARQRHHARPLQLPDDPRRPPPRMITPHAHDPRLNDGAHLMRARHRPRRPVRQPRQPTAAGIPGQPLVHRLPRHPIPARHFNDRRAFLQDLQHRPIPLLHDTQLHQHTRPLSPRSATDRSEADQMRKSRQPVRSVAHLPELLSPSYRNHVRKLSPGNQNQGVQHLPGSHSLAHERPRTVSPHQCPHRAVDSARILLLTWSPLTESNRRPSPYHGYQAGF